MSAAAVGEEEEDDTPGPCLVSRRCTPPQQFSSVSSGMFLSAVKLVSLCGADTSRQSCCKFINGAIIQEIY